MSRLLCRNKSIELLEPYEGKLSRTVLRGERGSNALDLPDVQKQGDFFVESPIILFASIIRSEERRVGKECRSRWSPYH